MLKSSTDLKELTELVMKKFTYVKEVYVHNTPSKDCYQDLTFWIRIPWKAALFPDVGDAVYRDIYYYVSEIVIVSASFSLRLHCAKRLFGGLVVGSYPDVIEDSFMRPRKKSSASTDAVDAMAAAMEHKFD